LASGIERLQLSEALALLGDGVRAQLPDAHQHPIDYLQAIIDGLCNVSLRDPLTGATNRRHLMTALEGELDRWPARAMPPCF